MKPNSPSGCNRQGFTLVELLVALGVGMYIVGLAFAALSFISKAIRRADILAAKTDAAQQLILWSMMERASNLNSVPLMTARTGGIMGVSAHLSLYQSYILTQTTSITAITSAITGDKITVKTPMEIYINQPVCAFDLADPTTPPITGTITNISTGSGSTKFTVSFTGPKVGWTVGAYEILYAPRMSKP